MIDTILQYVTPLSVTIYFIVINLVTYYLYALDKFNARKHRWRVSEASLLFLGLIGGTPAAFYAQRRLRHKTKKLSFRLQFWLTVFVQVGAIIFYLYEVA